MEEKTFKTFSPSKLNLYLECPLIDSSRALKTFNDAVKSARGKRPDKHSECKFCAWAEDNWKFE